MGIVSLITAILKAIPALKDLFDQFVAEYTRREIANMKAEYQKAIEKAINDRNQIDLEKALGSQFAGLPSGNAGAKIVDSLPGVPPLDPPK